MRNNIHQLRKQMRLSQEELAVLVGVTRQTINGIEGERFLASLPLAFRIARFFGLTIEEVFDYSEEEDYGDE